MKGIACSFCFLVVVAIAVKAEDILEQISQEMELPKEDVKQCLSDVGVSIEDLEDATKLDENVDEADVKEAALKIGCFVACVYHKHGIMDESRISVDKIHEFIDRKYDNNETMKKTLHNSVDPCNDEVKDIDDECKVALLFTICIMKESKSDNE